MDKRSRHQSALLRNLADHARDPLFEAAGHRQRGQRPVGGNGHHRLVMLIACTNVANLLLVRAEGRQQELSIRAALGAAAPALPANCSLRSVLLGFIGGVLGVAVAYGGLRLLRSSARESSPLE